MMKAYGLEQAGYTFRTGTTADWVGAFERGVAERRWVVLPTWQPQFLNQAYNIRLLEERKGLLGAFDRAVLVAHKEFPSKVPPRTLTVLRRISLGVPAVTAMDYAVNVEKKTPREAARIWMAANHAVVEEWFYQGGRALADAIIDACTRDASPCTKAIAAMRSGLASHGYLESRPAASQSSSEGAAPSAPLIDPVRPLHLRSPPSGPAGSLLALR